MTAINFLREYSLGKPIKVVRNRKVETAKVVTYLRNKKDEIVGFIAKCKDGSVLEFRDYGGDLR
jgi:hypothetical protein